MSGTPTSSQRPPPREPRETRVYTPSLLNAETQVVLESAFGLIWLEGELSNFSRPASGHWYFTIKDARAQVRCAMFRNRNGRTGFKPTDGMQVLLRARVSLYVARGEFQCIAEHMEPAGEGALRLAFEQLRTKLEAEGLFDAARKRTLPALPRRIAVITSATGAAVRDVLNVTGRRWPLAEIQLLPAAVQGAEAAREVVAALQQIDRLVSARPDMAPDLVIVGRGGGSLEDLQAFNDEAVARAIAACSVPVVSAVGHETDTTIADFVADVRAPTPSAAAELATPDAAEWLAAFGSADAMLGRGIQRQLQQRREQLRHTRRRLRHPGILLRDRMQRADELDSRLRRAFSQRRDRQAERVQQLRQRLQLASPRQRLRRDGQQLARLRQRLRRLSGQFGTNSERRQQHLRLQQRLQRAATSRLEQWRQRQLNLVGRLDALSPLRVLDRGYAILSRAEGGQILRSAADASSGDALQARLARGRLQLQVTRVDADDDPTAD